ncbi:MAG: LLM class flavin-dependent oxidoreductase [Actinomycetota bacterium]|nr:LLM class flavin-dependent oxidoreductase [Actinomycetota bacterium]
MTDIHERGHQLRFGLVTPQMWRSWDDVLELWSRAEAAGWDAAFVVDHFISDWEGEMGANLEAFTTLGALAREVDRIQLGVFVAGITHRPPMVLLKAATTLDQVSDGRFVFGLGAAWNEREHEAYGIPFPTPRDRVGAVEETLTALRYLEVQDRTDFVGQYLHLVNAPFEPKPVRGRLPVAVGSRRPRMLDILSRFGDYWDTPGSIEDVISSGEMLDAACRRHGRNPDDIVWMHEEIARDSHATPDGLEARVAALSEVGVSFFLVNIWPRSDSSAIERLGTDLERLRERMA